MNNFTWQFPRNDSNETEGPNDGGITHFTANRSANVIRESIQNSLDARDDESKPVIVEIALTSLPPESFNADGLLDALDAAIKSNHNDDTHRQQFKKGQSLLLSSVKGVGALCIVDSNTTGANDDLSLDGKPTKWEALTKSSGLSIKDQPDAGGSFGLGKHAPFAATDIRTVLYATAWGSPNEMHGRFQGKTILVSHEDSGGNKRRRTGYFGSDHFNPLLNNDIPERFRLEQPGLAVYILGYIPETDWQGESVRSAIEHFFHAIIHQGLEVKVDGKSVTAATLDEYLHLVGQRTVGFIQASRTIPVAETDIADIGHVTLRLVSGDNGAQGGRQIALVRDVGMMITDRTRDMSLTGLGRFPPHWQSFSAIVECRSSGQPSVLRESESPSHTSISTQQISDRQRRGRANAALKELGNWCRKEIGARVEAKPTEEIENADEVARYLAINDDEGKPGAADFGNLGQMTVTKPNQSTRAPASNWARRGKRVAGQTTGGEGKTEQHHKKGKGSKRKSSGTTARTVPSALANVRFQPATRRPTHSIIATFDAIPETLRNIQLMATVEDGQDVQVVISEAYAGSRRLSVKHNKVASFSPGDVERCSIEFRTPIPVSNKTYVGNQRKWDTFVKERLGRYGSGLDSRSRWL